MQTAQQLNSNYCLLGGRVDAAAVATTTVCQAILFYGTARKPFFPGIDRLFETGITPTA